MKRGARSLSNARLLLHPETFGRSELGNVILPYGLLTSYPLFFLHSLPLTSGEKQWSPDGYCAQSTPRGQRAGSRKATGSAGGDGSSRGGGSQQS